MLQKIDEEDKSKEEVTRNSASSSLTDCSFDEYQDLPESYNQNFENSDFVQLQMRSFKIFQNDFAHEPSKAKNRRKCCSKKKRNQGIMTSNMIRTSKYTVLNFIPKNLWEQFRQLANFYFLVIAVLQCLPAITITNGQPMELLPLGFIVIVTMLKDIFEDRKRHKFDNEENNREIEVFDPVQLKNRKDRWRNIKVGQILKIYNNQYIPADLILIKSSEKSRVCYIESKILDGETNLKQKTGDKFLGYKIKENDPKTLLDLKGRITCDDSNDQIYKFEGAYYLEEHQKKLSLNYNNLILRGCRLKNTEWVMGIVVYTGNETKIMKNSANAKFKMSGIEKGTNRQIVQVVIIQFVFCLFAATWGLVWNINNFQDSYDPEKQGKIEEEESVGIFFTFFGNWVLIFTNFIPISLLVTLELVKFFQAIFIQNECLMFDRVQGLPASVQASNLNEELGQIEYLFSDKTGTMTCNVMQFRKFSAGKVSYGSSEKTQDQKFDYINFHDEGFNEQWYGRLENYQCIRDVLLHLAICHTVVPDNTKATFNGPSPDEVALVTAAKHLGVEFIEKDDNNNIFINIQGEEIRYKLLQVLEFSSARKRMSVIVRDFQDNIFMYTKGADSAIIPNLKPGNNIYRDDTIDFVDNYAREGLRTLILCKRHIQLNEYQQWKSEYDRVSKQDIGREQEMDRIYEQIEQHMIVIGSTAIEDKLQDGVYETIQFMKEAGIKVWVLTGDKVETAINIGYSSGLLDPNMKQYDVIEPSYQGNIESIDYALGKLKSNDSQSKKTALILSGEALLRLYHDDEGRDKLLQLCELVNVVLACRVSPKQKSDIVQMVRKRFPNKTTLAIGDGANDVSMITTAHVGVGIAGLEGQQAARSADFVIGQFRFLKPLLFIHGREAYRRNSFLVCYNFYKNALFVLPMFWYGAFSAFSGQTIYESWIYQLYNIVFTSIPIMYYSVFALQYEKQYYLNHPRTYILGLQHKCFGTQVFWKWMIYGSVQSIILLFVALQPLQMIDSHDSTGSPMNLWFGGYNSKVGKEYSIWAYGVVVYASVVIVANLRIIQSYRIFNIYGELICFLSVLCFFLCLLVQNYWYYSTNYVYGVFPMLVTSPIFWLQIFFCTFAVHFLDQIIGETFNFLTSFRKECKDQLDNIDGNMSEPFSVRNTDSSRHSCIYNEAVNSNSDESVQDKYGFTHQKQPLLQ